MAEIGCKKCSSPDCKGCNNFILETALKQGRFDALMNGNGTLHIAADVRENVKGRWIKMSRCDKCSVCGWETGRYGSASKFCPDCGAQMMGGAEDGE